ncbi:acetate kinase [Compostibacter hankyongensis]|uniref:Acetate kinase n=1 Tax=Compostibacter hankyongensis TaxID=1007089 RepID=A0ABP8G518_9BACT
MHVLVINAGSSSLKYEYIDTDTRKTLCSGLADRIGLPGSSLVHRVYTEAGTTEQISQKNFPDHTAAMQEAVTLLTRGQHPVVHHPEAVKAIGHRVVHGGEAYTHTVLINDAVKADIRRLSPLVPLHNPANLQGIAVAEAFFPQARHIAVFDTAFHQTMPARAYRYAIPNELYEKQGIRSFGFHGISHAYVSREAAHHLGNPGARIITLHLGNGCSMAAVQNGRSIDTSMGLGALDGLIMGTRSGQLDPTVIFYLTETLGYKPGQVRHLLNKESGLKGLSGFSDMREVHRAADAGEKEARLALDMYAYRIKKFIGAYIAAMNGVDALVFTAGVGENDAAMRAQICSDLDFFGIRLDRTRNEQKSSELREIQISGALPLLVVPTREELAIAVETARLITDHDENP